MSASTATILRSCGIESCTEENIVELANGCLCCTVADDFVPAIEALLAHENRPEHIIVETSGLALPKPLVKAFDWPAIRAKLTVDGVIAVVDGAAVAAGRFADDPDAVLAAARGGRGRRSRQPAGGGLRGPASLRRPRRPQQGRPAGRARRSTACSAEIGARDAARREGRAGLARAGSTPAVLLGLAAAAEDDLANRPSHHDAEEGHDHDDFDSFVARHRRPRPIRPTWSRRLRRRRGGARRAAHEGLRRGRGQADAPARAGRRQPLPPPVRPAPGSPARRAAAGWS